jgi:hypothetical protein
MVRWCAVKWLRGSAVYGNGNVLMSSTIETLERELGDAQEEREAEQRAVVGGEKKKNKGGWMRGEGRV